eukprot:Skav225525  [mRNA]  locus=scaffold144:59739:63723:+ [translate_table: standard]
MPVDLPVEAAILLGIAWPVHRAEVESAFRRRALRCHPDRHPKAQRGGPAVALTQWRVVLLAMDALAKVRFLRLSKAKEAKEAKEAKAAELKRREALRDGYFEAPRAEAKLRKEKEQKEMEDLAAAAASDGPDGDL